MTKKLARLKSHYLSLGGRLTLVNSKLDALPTYMMGLFPIPGCVEEKIDKLRRDFLWQDNKQRRSWNLLKWEKLTLNKKQGGLGIRNFSFHNQSLLQIWLWRSNFEDNTIWRKFISQKYVMPSLWTTLASAK